MTFVRTVEDFVCEHCGAEVRGSGYTNHCPRCLWSKHVDNEPGDRANDCHGLMRPVSLEGSTPEYVIVHKCESCGVLKRNSAQAEDSDEALVALAAQAASKK